MRALEWCMSSAPAACMSSRRTLLLLFPAAGLQVVDVVALDGLLQLVQGLSPVLLLKALVNVVWHAHVLGLP